MKKKNITTHKPKKKLKFVNKSTSKLHGETAKRQREKKKGIEYRALHAESRQPIAEQANNNNNNNNKVPNSQQERTINAMMI